jgi:hypothetical protein
MDLWLPSDCNRELPLFLDLEDVTEDQLQPDPTHYEHWARRSLAEQLSQASEGEDALWASVMGLRRLKYLERISEMAGEEVGRLWRLHASAWLVSDDGCSRFERGAHTTFPSVVSFPSAFISPSSPSQLFGSLRKAC